MPLKDEYALDRLPVFALGPVCAIIRVSRYLYKLMNRPQRDRMIGQSLRQIALCIPDTLTDEVLDVIDEELAEL